MNDGISTRCENASSATLKVAAEMMSKPETFLYLEKENHFRMKQFGGSIATYYGIILSCWWV
jgi:hypothetical protein